MQRPLLSFVILSVIFVCVLSRAFADTDTEGQSNQQSSNNGQQLTPQEIEQQQQSISQDPQYNLVQPVVGQVFKGLDGKPVTQNDINQLKTYLSAEQAARQQVMNLPDTNRARERILAIMNKPDPGDPKQDQLQIYQLIKQIAKDNPKIDVKALREAAKATRQQLTTDMNAMKGKNPFFEDLQKHDVLAKIAELQPLKPGNGGAPTDSIFPPPIDAAQAAIQNGDAAGAMDNLNDAISDNPQDGQALSLRAGLNMANGNVSGAASDAQAALGVIPGDERAQKILSLTQGRSGTSSTEAMDNASALGADKSGAGGGAPSGGGASAWLANMAVSQKSGPSNAAVSGGQQALTMGEYKSAINNATNAIALNPDNVQAYSLRASAYNSSHQYALALKDAIEGLKRDPKNTALLLERVKSLNKLHRYSEAEAIARQLLELDPNNAAAYNALAEALAGQHKNVESIAALKTAAQLDPVFNQKLKQAIQLPADSDLTFLFPDDDAASAPKASPAELAAQRLRRFKFIAGASILGGLLLAYGILQFFMPQIKDALTQLTRRGPSVSQMEIAQPTPAPRPVASAALTERSPGLIKGQYQIGRKIGEGGMGLVFEGRDVTLRRPVAIKKMRDELRVDPRERTRFVAEAKVVAGLHHPAIVDIYAIAEQGDDVYLIFEYVTGKTLHEIVHGGKPLSLGQAIGIIKAAGDGLDYAHSHNVIHRDLKPSNIMITADGRVKVMDFGIARLAKDAMSKYSLTNTVVGTPPYMAPEQEQGVVRRESDVYGLAVCLYEMITGRLPFNGANSGMLMNKINMSYVPPSKMVAGLSSGVDDVFARAFAPDPEKRFHSAKEFVAGLESLALPQRG
jgi:tetratricopeptide (TPR) repeat protein